MSPEQLSRDAQEAMQSGQRMTLVHPKGAKRPAGFPRGELLAETPTGQVRSHDPANILKWLENAYE